MVNPISFPIKIAMQGLRLRVKTPFLTHLHMSLRLMEVDHADCGQDFCPADLPNHGVQRAVTLFSDNPIFLCDSSGSDLVCCRQLSPIK